MLLPWWTILAFCLLFEKSFLLHAITPIQTDGWRRGTEIRKLFLEYQSIFSDIFGKTSKEILLQFSFPIHFESISSETLAELLAKLSRQKVGTAKAEQLKAAASSSFGVTFAKNSFTFQLKTLIEQISFIEKQVKETESEISGIMGKLESPITTITGIGSVTGATILSKIGDISKFDNPRKLVAFAGLDATITQSGEFETAHNVMSKRGSPYLRKAIFQATLVASFKDPVLSSYYQKKKAEDKHHLTCVGAVARKMCNIIYAVLKNNQPYVPKA